MQDNEKVGELYFVGENQYEDITYLGPYDYGVYDFTIAETQNGFLTMIAHLTSNFTENYDPNSMKFDIIIQNWVYQNNENQLALLVEYRTESETEDEDKEEENQILWYGIIFGFIVIFGYSSYLKYNYGDKGVLLAVVFITSYINGCIHDINRLSEI